MDYESTIHIYLKVTKQKYLNILPAFSNETNVEVSIKSLSKNSLKSEGYIDKSGNENVYTGVSRPVSIWLFSLVLATNSLANLLRALDTRFTFSVALEIPRDNLLP